MVICSNLRHKQRQR
ncbi:hypothetical protein AMTRI_Chr03g140500 [Amborella trichopoda]